MNTNINHTALAVLLAATLTGLGQPVITKQPGNRMPYVGSTTNFSITVSGSPPPTYQWRFNGADLPGKTNSTLGLNSVQFTNAGPYSVVVSNDGGSVTSETAWLSVLPTNVVNLGDRELRFGELSTSLVWVAPRKDDAGQSLTGDGLTLFYSSTAQGGSGDLDLWMVTRPALDSTNWSAPVNLGPTVNSSEIDENPSLSPDGLSLYFDSLRPGGQGGYDIWVATRPNRNSAFGTPVNLGPHVNSAYDDGIPIVSADNCTLVFTSINRPGGLGDYDVWMSTRADPSLPWGPATNPGAPINSTDGDFPVALSRDGLLLFIKSWRPITVGPEEAAIYVCRRSTPTQPFGPPVVIRPILVIGSGGADYCSLSDDGTTLWVGRYKTVYPDWPQVLQLSVTALPQLTAAGRGASGEYQFDLLGRQGATYEIQTSSDLSTWTPWLTTNLTDRLRLSDPMPAPEGRRFYRALSH